MGAVNALGQANPLVKSVIDSLMGTMAKNPAAIQEISSVVEKIAQMKNLSVEELINSGGLGRALLEKFTQGAVVQEEKVTELQSMSCDKCGHIHYQMVEQYRPRSPLAQLAGVAKAS
ncbi:P12 [Pseudomonas phage phi2954]|uniref:p12 n=1 Tax=Pseudomonas phage phi2954 TaxID=593131 RepID=C0KIU5_9VIRU|nr:P12 [Pseudomonas phage phi2954]ACM91130.1 P12 [Pseudomonas phage phi2954]